MLRARRLLLDRARLSGPRMIPSLSLPLLPYLPHFAASPLLFHDLCGEGMDPTIPEATLITLLFLDICPVPLATAQILLVCLFLVLADKLLSLFSINHYRLLLLLATDALFHAAILDHIEDEVVEFILQVQHLLLDQ